MFSVIIQNDEKRVVRLQAMGDNGCQYELQEEFYIAGRVNAVKKHGVVARGKGEDDRQFAMKLLQKVMEQK